MWAQDEVFWRNVVGSGSDLTLDRLASPLPRASDSAFLLTGVESAILLLLVQVRLRGSVEAYRVDDEEGVPWKIKDAKATLARVHFVTFSPLPSSSMHCYIISGSLRWNLYFH